MEEAVDWKNLPAESAGAKGDQFVVVFVPPGAAGEWRKAGRGFLRSGDSSTDPRTITVNGNDRKLELQPGRAVVQCPAKDFDAVLAALVEFTFYHGELLDLEQALAADEAHARADAPLAFRITRASRKHWQRWGETIERLAVLRLRFARLEPCLYKASPGLPIEARRVMTRLLDKADIEDRLTAYSDRLEACEDLYEGASDRAADYRWYRGGHWLEVGIIALLLIEGVIMATGVYYQVLDYHHTIQIDAADEK